MSCPTFPERTLSDLGENLQIQLQGRRYPLSGLLELTERCNLSCVHCYINQSAACQQARNSELNTDQLKYMLDQMADAGVLFLIISGGEPLLRKDFPEIYIHAKRRGILTGIFTNGTLVTPDIADLFVEYRPNWIDITMYGGTQQTYETVTRQPGSYDRFIKGINLLLERGLPVYLKSALLTINRHEISAMRSFAENLGITNFRYDGMLWPRLDGSLEPFTYRVSPEEMAAIDLDDPNRLSEWVRIAQTFSGVRDRADYVYTCGAGLQSFNIDSAGRMSMCNMSRQPSYDLLQMSFQQGWENLGELRKKQRQYHTQCETCTLGALCAQCAGWSQIIHGDDETPVEFICELAHLRRELIQPFPTTSEEMINYEKTKI